MDPITIAAVTGLASAGVGFMGSKSAGKKSSKYQKRAFRHEVNMWNRRKDLMQPIMDIGLKALGQQADILGLTGPDAQQQAVSDIESSPLFTSMLQQGEEAILAQQAATGGLRGGDTQRALMEFRPNLLNQQILQRFGNLSGLAGQGVSATQAVVGDLSQVAARQSQNLQNIGAIGAGQTMGQSQAISDGLGGIGQSAILKGILGNLQGLQDKPSTVSNVGPMRSGYQFPSGPPQLQIGPYAPRY